MSANRTPEEFAEEAARMSLVPGPWLFRYVKDGPLMPARVNVGADGWSVEIDGVTYEAHPDPIHAPRLIWLWEHGRPCTELEYAYRSSLVKWAREHDPEAPEANPRRPYDPALARPIF